jgi:hypothetical protein
MAAVSNPARSFVNMIVRGYDKGCHEGTPNIPDIFNPGLEDGLKENSLGYFSEKFSKPPEDMRSDPPRKMTIVELEAEVVTQYKQSAPTLSNLFALAGILDAPSQDPARQKIQSHIIEVLVQDHLRNKKDYALDPMALMVLAMGSSMAKLINQPEPLPQFADGKRHFCAQIFQEVFSRCSVPSKRKIIRRLEKFESVLNTRSARLQRVVFKVEGTFNHYITNSYVKFGVSIAFGVVSYFAVYKMIALAGQVFASPIFISFSTAVISRMPVIVVQISSGAYTRTVEVVAYVATTRIYGVLFNSGKLMQMVVCKTLPVMSWVYAPVGTFASRIQGICYERMFGPDARTQIAIWKGLKDCTDKQKKELLEGGMKAYQVWMYLMEQGPEKGLFN